MRIYLYIAQIILGVALTAVILIQTHNSAAGSLFGGTDSAIYRTRRGVERTLFIITIALSVVFFLIVILSAIVSVPS